MTDRITRSQSRPAGVQHQHQQQTDLTPLSVTERIRREFPNFSNEQYKEFETRVASENDMLPDVWRWLQELTEKLKLREDEVKSYKLVALEHQKRIEELESDNIELHRRSLEPPQSQSSTSAVPKKSVKMPDPEVFKTGDSDEWEVFKITIQDKLQYNEDHFGSEGAKIAYLRGRLGGEAQQIALPYSQAATATIQSVLRALDRRFADPQAKKTARNNYTILRQGDKVFPEFLGLFQKYAIRAEIPEYQQMDDIIDKCNATLQQASFGFRFDTLDQVVDHLHHVVSQVKTYTSIQSTSERTPTMGSRRTSPNRSPPPRTSSPPRRLPTCLNCEKPGHIARACPHQRQPGFEARLAAFRSRLVAPSSSSVNAVELPAYSNQENVNSALQSQ